MKTNIAIYIYVGMFAVLLWFDRFTKNLVITNMNIGESIPPDGAFFSIHYTINTGVSFSMLEGQMEVLIIIQAVLFAVVTAACIITFIKLRHPMLQTSLVWIIAGGLGNLIDRILFGYVVDFISVGTFPIWNFADMCIVGGCILLVIYLLFLYPKRQKEALEEETEAASGDE